MNGVIPSSASAAPLRAVARGEASQASHSSFRRRGWGIVPTSGVIAVVLIAPALHPYATVGVLSVLAAWSLLGSKQALQALSLAVIVKFLNPVLYPIEGPVGLCAWSVLGLAGVRILLDGFRFGSLRHPVIGWLLIFALAIGIESVFFSRASLVSVFKVLSFTYMAATILVGFRVTVRRGVDWTPWFAALWSTVVTLSLPTLLVRDIGFHTNGLGFQGILNQPQALGVFIAPLIAWVAGRLILARARRPLWLYLALPAGLVLIYLTGARTALAAIAAGAIAVFLGSFFRGREWRTAIRQGMFRPISILLAFAVVALLLLKTEAVMDRVSGFVRKDDSQTVSESFETSRGRAIGNQWANFTENPMFGIGFGVSLDPSFEPVIDRLTGLPLSAPVEKGFLPTAVLEETGIFGAFFCVLLLGSSIRRVVARGDIILAWVFFTCLMVNVGEMIFFSAGGLGLYIWLLMGWALASLEAKRAP